jgi:hypothetical protein
MSAMAQVLVVIVAALMLAGLDQEPLSRFGLLGHATGVKGSPQFGRLGAFML